MIKKQHLGLIIISCLILLLGALFWVSSVQTAVSPFIKINNGVSNVKTREVSLFIQGPEGTKYMKVSNNSDFSDASWESYSTHKKWTLSFGSGTKIVFVKFKDSKNKESKSYEDRIQLSIPKSMVADFYINIEVDEKNKDKKISAKETNSRYVSLDLEYSSGVEGYIVSNDNNFSGLTFKKITKNVSWVLSSGEGKKTVYAQFLDGNGEKVTVSKDIIYNQPEVYIEEGALVKGQGSSIYYYGYDGRLHPFLSVGVYHSWYKDFKNIRYISNTKLSQYRMGQPVCIRPGTWLVKFKSMPQIYAVLPGCNLQPILSEAEAYIIYGKKWSSMVLELDTVESGAYHILTNSVADKDLGIVDRDRDGVSSDIEKEYGSSDISADTDGDGLTDLEEINYWFTDPTSKDTDGDGYNDMVELLNGYPAAGYGNLNTLLVGTYQYPAGAVIKKYTDGKLYYKHTDGYYYYLGRDIYDRVFESNSFDSRFVVESPFKIDFEHRQGWYVADHEDEVYYPTQLLGGDIVKL